MNICKEQEKDPSTFYLLLYFRLVTNSFSNIICYFQMTYVILPFL